MDVIVFYSLNGHFIYVNEYLESKRKIIFDNVFLDSINSVCTGNDLSSLLGIEGVSNIGVYQKVVGDKHVYFYRKTILDFFGKKRKLSLEVDSLLSKFRHRKKEQLLESIEGGLGLGQFLEELSEYVFGDEFSLWLYNKHTRFYTCESSSFSIDKDYICGGYGTSLDEIVEADSDFIRRPILSKVDSGEILEKKGIKSLNRIRIDMDDHENNIAVATFYSKNENFEISIGVLERLKTLIKNKYREEIQKSYDRFEKLSGRIMPMIDKEDEITYVSRYVREICQLFCYEAASVFIKDGNFLVCVATYTDAIDVDVVDGDIKYPLELDSLTTATFNRKEIYCSYDISKDRNNSNFFNEQTFSPAKNWIGFPIRSDASSEPIGVLRVKNKYVLVDGKREVVPPKPLHFQNIIKSIPILFESYDILVKHESVNKSLLSQNEFNKVLLHEIRTPISKFSMGPQILIRQLERMELDDGVRIKLVNQLKDIQAMGGRLKYITDCYNIEEIIRVSEIQTMSLLNKLVYPVINITKPYLEVQHECFINVNQNLMHGVLVEGDERLYNIALNALLDNAAKYCLDLSKVIDIDCFLDERYAYLSVRNIGYPIFQSERNLVFTKSFRGSSVHDKSIHGTGIGLYLAKEIMNNSGGDLYLEDNEDEEDIKFVLKIPLARRLK